MQRHGGHRKFLQHRINVDATSFLQRRISVDASMLMRRCINIMCMLGSLFAGCNDVISQRRINVDATSWRTYAGLQRHIKVDATSSLQRRSIVDATYFYNVDVTSFLKRRISIAATSCCIDVNATL